MTGIYKTLSDAGQPMMVRRALVRVHNSTFLCALTVPSSLHRITCLSREERVSPWPAGWIPNQDIFRHIPHFHSRLFPGIKNAKEVVMWPPCPADWRRSWHSLSVSDLSIIPLCEVGHSPVSHWVAGDTVSPADAVEGWGCVLPMGYSKDASALAGAVRMVLKSFRIFWSVTTWLHTIFL